MSSGYLALIDSLAKAVTTRSSVRPLVGVVLGSGLGAYGDQLPEAIPYSELPGMPASQVAGHSGKLRLGTIDGIGVACLQGRVHLYEGHDAKAVTLGVNLLARLGCRAVLLTNAAGGIAQNFAAGDRMLISDHLNLTGQESAWWGLTKPASAPGFPRWERPTTGVSPSSRMRRRATPRSS